MKNNKYAQKYTPELADKIVGLIGSGNFASVAYKACGVSKFSFYNWQKKYPEFKEKVEKAKAVRIATLIQDIRKDTSWQSKAWMLERLNRKKYHLPTAYERELEDRLAKLEGSVEK